MSYRDVDPRHANNHIIYSQTVFQLFVTTLCFIATNILLIQLEIAGNHCFCFSNGNSWITNSARVWSTIHCTGMQLLSHMLRSMLRMQMSVSMARLRHILIKVGFEKDLKSAPFLMSEVQCDLGSWYFMKSYYQNV